MGRMRATPAEELRDPAEYSEASCGPDEIQDSLEDLIREAAHPVRLHDDAVKKLMALLQAGNNGSADCPAPTMAQRVRMLNEFLERFHPNKWTLTNWWAMHFAIHSKSTEGLSPSALCLSLGISRQSFYYYVRHWRTVLGMAKNKDLRRLSISLAHKRRRQLNGLYEAKFAKKVRQLRG